MPASDALSTFMAWAAAPFQAPSGSSLATLMTRDIGPETGPVLELGAGGGAITRALLERGVLEDDLTLVELDPTFAGLLNERFPRARVFEMDAVGLRHLALFPGQVVGAALSSLPLRFMTPRRVRAVLEGVFANLRPEGALYLATTGQRCPVDETMLDSLDLKAGRIGYTFRSFPPATVYRIDRLKPGKRYDWRFG